MEGYKLTFRSNNRFGVANIEPAKGRKVRVGIWQISARDEKNLDRYEGFPWLYEKQEFIVRVNGIRVKAIAYVIGLPSVLLIFLVLIHCRLQLSYSK